MELQQETLPPPAYENWMRWRFKMALEAVGDIKKHHRWSLSEPVCLVHNSKRTTKSRCIFSPRRVRLQELSQQEHQETFHHPALISLCPVFLTFIHFFFLSINWLVFTPKSFFPVIHTCSHPGLLLYHCVPSAASARAEHCWSQAGCQGESGPHAGFGPQPKFILFKNAALPHPLSSYSPPFLWWATWETAGSNLLTVLSWLSLQERRLFGSKQIAKLDRLQLSAFFLFLPLLCFSYARRVIVLFASPFVCAVRVV